MIKMNYFLDFFFTTMLLSMFVFVVFTVNAGANVLTNLQTEYRINPCNIDVAQPRFSWVNDKLDRGGIQTAYQILVASNLDNLNADRGDMWDSGKILSDRSVNIPYQGALLQSGKKYFWKIRTWCKMDKESEYSDAASFEMGLLNEGDWQGQWIGHLSPKVETTEKQRGPWGLQIEGGGGVLRKEFTVSQPISRARVYVSGIGYYELHINGEKVGDHVLDPARTNYLTRVFYSAFDVTKSLVQGKNALGIMLGQGWYLGTPRAIVQLNIEFENGATQSVVSDESWKCSTGPIIMNSIYNGETFDARLEEQGWDKPDFNDYSWKSVTLPGFPGGKLVSQTLTPIKVLKTIAPAKLTQPKKDVWVFDMGQNMTGWCQLAVEGPAGTEITLEYSELLYPEGMINNENLRSAKCTDKYILKGTGTEIYEPKFTFHGFRYVQITGFPGTPSINDIRGRVVHSAINENWKSKFLCSNELLNKIQHLVLWGQAGNLIGYPSDCPQRDERQGWDADAHVSAEEAMYNFNMASLYAKWIADIQSNQEPNGFIPDITPTETGKGVRNDDPAWDSVYPLMVWYFYQYYDDVRILEQQYDGIKKYVDYLTSKAEGNILYIGTYGDWIAPEKTPLPLVNTGYYFYDAQIVAQVAGILGKKQDARAYNRLAEEINLSFNKKFYSSETGEYGNGTAFSNVWPLFLGLVPEWRKEAVIKKLIDHIMIDWNGHISTGTLGTKYIFDVLVDNGYADVAYTITTQETYPGWGYMVANGATTLWELWENRTGTRMNSHNHIMLGAITEWYYKHLAGIQMEQGIPGFKKIVIKPVIVGNLQNASGTTQTIRGIVSSKWERNGKQLQLHVSIPYNCEATVYVPLLKNTSITICEGNVVLVKNDSPTGNCPEIKYLGKEKDYAVFAVGSGSYNFSMTGESMWDK